MHTDDDAITPTHSIEKTIDVDKIINVFRNAGKNYGDTECGTHEIRYGWYDTSIVP